MSTPFVVYVLGYAREPLEKGSMRSGDLRDAEGDDAASGECANGCEERRRIA